MAAGALLRILAPGSAQSYAAEVLMLATGLAGAVITARALPPTDRGTLAYLVLIPTLIALVGSIGLPYGSYFFWNRASEGTRAHVLGTIAATTATLSLPLVAGSWLCLGLVQGSWTLKLLAAASTPLVMVNGPLTLALLASDRLTLYNASRVFPTVLYMFSLTMLFLIGSLRVASALWAWSGTMLLTAIMDYGLVGSVAGYVPTYEGAHVRKVLRFGIRTHPARVAEYGTLRIDQALLAVLGNRESLGLYSVAVPLAEMVWYLANSVGSAVLAKVQGVTGQRQRRLVLVAAGLVCALSLPMCVALFVGAPTAVRVALGERYMGAVPAVRLLLPGVFAFGIARVLNFYFIAVGRPSIPAWSTGVGLAITVGADFALIPVLHARGAALAASLAYLGVAAIAVIAFLRDRVDEGAPEGSEEIATLGAVEVYE